MKVKSKFVVLLVLLAMAVSCFAMVAVGAEEPTPSKFRVLTDGTETEVPTLTEEDGVASLSGKLANGTALLVLDQELSLSNRVSFDLNINYDSKGVTTEKVNDQEIYEFLNYFTLNFQQPAQFATEEGGEPAPSAGLDDLTAKNFIFDRWPEDGATNGLQMKICYTEEWLTWSDRVNMYDFVAGGTQIERGLTISSNTAREDWSAAYNSGYTIHVVIGKEFYENQEQMYYQFTTYLRDSGPLTTVFRTPLTNVIGASDSTAPYYLSLGVTNTVPSLSSTIDIKVSNLLIEDLSGTISDRQIYLQKEQEKQLSATFEDEGTIEWKSDDESIATVDQNGKVTGVSGGNTKVTARIGGAIAECTVYVVEDLSINKKELTISAGRDYIIEAMSNPQGLKNEWVSTNEEVATVDENGMVHGVAPGTCQIKAVLAGIEAVCDVTVQEYTQVPDVVEDEYSILFSEGAEGGVNITNTTYGYATNGSIRDGYMVFAVNAPLDLSKVYSFDLTVTGDSTHAWLANEAYLGKYMGIYLNQMNPQDGALKAEDFVTYPSGSDVKNGAQLNLHFVYDWMHVGIGYNRGMHFVQSAGGWSQRNTLETLPYGNALAMTLNSGGLKVKVRLAVEGENLVMTLHPYTAAGNLVTDTATFPGYSDAPYGPVTFTFPMERVVTNPDAEGNYYMALVFGNEINGADSALNFRIDNINTGDPEGITLNRDTLSVEKGKSEQLFASLLPSGVEGCTVQWISSNELIAQVDQSGNVTGVSSGTADITVQIAGTNLSAVCKVTVIGNVTITRPEKTQFQLTDSSVTLTAASDPAGAELKWSSSDIRIATVDKNGKVSFKKEGTVVITASFGDISDKIELTIGAAPEEGEQGGCGSSIAGGSGIALAGLVVVGAAALVMLKNRKEKKK